MAEWKYIYSDYGVYWHNPTTHETTQLDAPHPSAPNTYFARGGYEDMEKWHNLRVAGWQMDGHTPDQPLEPVIASRKVASVSAARVDSSAGKMNANDGNDAIGANDGNGQKEKTVRVLGAVSPDVSKAVSPDVSKAVSPQVSKAVSPQVSKAVSPDVSKAVSPDVSKVLKDVPLPVSTSETSPTSPEAPARSSSPTPSQRSRTSTRTRTVVKATAIKVPSHSLLQFQYAGSQISSSISIANFLSQKAPTATSASSAPSKGKDSVKDQD